MFERGCGMNQNSVSLYPALCSVKTSKLNQILAPEPVLKNYWISGNDKCRVIFYYFLHLNVFLEFT